MNDAEKTQKLHERYRVQPGQKLTARECEVIAHLLRGLKNREIAVALFLHEKTVKFHLTRIFVKLGVKNRTQLILKTCSRDCKR